MRTRIRAMLGEANRYPDDHEEALAQAEAAFARLREVPFAVDGVLVAAERDEFDSHR